MAHRLACRVATQGRPVGEKHGIQAATLGDAGDVLVMGDIQMSRRPRLRLAPGTRMGAKAEDIQADADLPFTTTAHTALASSRTPLPVLCWASQAWSGVTPLRW